MQTTQLCGRRTLTGNCRRPLAPGVKCPIAHVDRKTRSVSQSEKLMLNNPWAAQQTALGIEKDIASDRYADAQDEQDLYVRNNSGVVLDETHANGVCRFNNESAVRQQNDLTESLVAASVQALSEMGLSSSEKEKFVKGMTFKLTSTDGSGLIHPDELKKLQNTANADTAISKAIKKALSEKLGEYEAAYQRLEDSKIGLALAAAASLEYCKELALHEQIVTDERDAMVAVELEQDDVLAKFRSNVPMSSESDTLCRASAASLASMLRITSDNKYNMWVKAETRSGSEYVQIDEIRQVKLPGVGKAYAVCAGGRIVMGQGHESEIAGTTAWEPTILIDPTSKGKELPHSVTLHHQS